MLDRQLPYEVWEKILDLCDGAALHSLQRASSRWETLVLKYASGGRLRGRARRLPRLSAPDPKSGRILEHSRRTWDSVGIRTSRDILLVGIGVFSPLGSASIISVDARTLDQMPPRKIDVDTKLESEDDGANSRALTIYAKKPFHLRAGKIWELVCNVAPDKGGFAWTDSGEGGREEVTMKEVTFEFFETASAFSDFHEEGDREDKANRIWRSDAKEGQFPHILYWPA